MRGLLKEILSLASWVIAFLVANAYGAQLAEFIPLTEQSIRLITAFVSLFIGVRLLMWLLTMALDSIITASGLKSVDRSLGSLFGAARGCVIVLALTFVCGMTNLPQQAFWREAFFRPTVETAALVVKPLLPGSFARYVNF
ncbi:putative membrane protein required for colicin V production [Solimicrobium silvestre]|uniref:Putative membrane protein required for colicin V production n=2 Tax=Solimicrobium silvestre TaxID=2099400 RepID=A0A2S9GZN1_9BURK|nr:putative membrane protein required for colicin V production [Solimicrobium silvestre]